MTRWQAVYRWIGAVLAVVLLAALWFVGFGRNLGKDDSLVGDGGNRLIDVVAELARSGTEGCSLNGVDTAALDLDARLSDAFTGCALVGSRSNTGALEWFFAGRAAGDGTVRVPRPVEVGQTRAALSNGAIVVLAPEVRVRCTADPNARFEIWIADGLATAGYLDPDGRLVAIDCTESTA